MTCWPDGYGRHVYDTLGSTLTEASRLAPELRGPVWILAHRQTEGRARRGRPWAMPKDNFAATLVLKPDQTAGVAALRSFVMSLALLRSFVSLTGQSRDFALKWPNDVLLKGGKVAGILLESTGQGAGLRHLAIGVGINLAAAPLAEELEPGAVRPVSLRAETGLTILPEAFLDVLAAEYAVLEADFAENGFAAIRAEWLRHAARLGEQIVARTGRREIHGRFEDVDTDGNLILATLEGRVAIAAADVFF